MCNRGYCITNGVGLQYPFASWSTILVLVLLAGPTRSFVSARTRPDLQQYRGGNFLESYLARTTSAANVDPKGITLASQFVNFTIYLTFPFNLLRPNFLFLFPLVTILNHFYLLTTRKYGIPMRYLEQLDGTYTYIPLESKGLNRASGPAISLTIGKCNVPR